MYVYGDPITKTCKIIETSCLLEAILQTNKGKGVLYFAEDNPEEENSRENMTEEQLIEFVVWKDGQLSNLGKTFIDFNNYRNYVD